MVDASSLGLVVPTLQLHLWVPKTPSALIDAFPVRQALQLYTAQAGVERLRAVERGDQNRDTRILADHFSPESPFFVTGRPVSPYNVACYTAVTDPVDSSEHDNHVRSMFRKC